MKKFIFIHGPNGVGKSTTCELLHNRLSNSAWIESEWTRKINPFVLNKDFEALTERNMTFLIRSYFQSEQIDHVILNWGFHGRRKKIYDRVLENISDIDFNYIPITLTCDEEENIKRMESDNRSSARISRALEVRKVYEDLPYYLINTTNLTVEEVVDKIIEYID